MQLGLERGRAQGARPFLAPLGDGPDDDHDRMVAGGGDLERSSAGLSSLVVPAEGPWPVPTHVLDRCVGVVERTSVPGDGGRQVVPGSDNLALVDERPLSHDVDRFRTDSKAARALSSASGRVCRYFCVVMICE